MIITIDGPVATGKSTIAKKLAEELGYLFFDTGAMYRAFTWLAIHHHSAFNTSEDLEKLFNEFDFNIKYRHGEKRYYVGNEDVTQAIRSADVTAHVSEVSAHQKVRENLVAMQRKLANGINAVFEGRDMGSVVFPHAELKIFLTARPEIRAKRRFEEIKAQFPQDAENLTLEKALENLNRRDNSDSTREYSPLKQADDAILVDTSDMDIEEVVKKILELKDSLKMKNSRK